MDWPLCPHCAHECKDDAVGCPFACDDVLFCSPKCAAREEKNDHYESVCSTVREAPRQLLSWINTSGVHCKIRQWIDLNVAQHGFGFVAFEFDNGIHLAQTLEDELLSLGRFVLLSGVADKRLVNAVLDVRKKPKSHVVVLLYREVRLPIFCKRI